MILTLDARGAFAGELLASQFAEHLGLWLKQLAGFLIVECYVVETVTNEGFNSTTGASSSDGSSGGGGRSAGASAAGSGFFSQ